MKRVIFFLLALATCSFADTYLQNLSINESGAAIITIPGSFHAQMISLNIQTANPIATPYWQRPAASINLRSCQGPAISPQNCQQSNMNARWIGGNTLILLRPILAYSILGNSFFVQIQGNNITNGSIRVFYPRINGGVG